MGKYAKKIISVVCIVAMLFTVVCMPVSVSAAKKVRLNKTKATVTVGEKVKLKMVNTKKKVTWITSKKKVATVSKKGVVKTKKVGKVKITAKCGGKKYVCKITVKKQGTVVNTSATPSSTGTSTSTPKPTSTVSKVSNGFINGTYPPGATATAPANEGSSLSSLPAAGSTGTMTVGKMAVTLGESLTDVKKAIGDPVRSEIAPQGYTTYVYNPGNDYKNLLYVNVANDAVVGMLSISAYISFENLVFSGDSIDTLKNNGFSSFSTYGNYSSYKRSTTDNTASVVAYVDYTNTKQTYCVQVYSKSYSDATMFKPVNCDYSSGVKVSVKDSVGSGSTNVIQMQSQALEVYDLINAYRMYRGFSDIYGKSPYTFAQDRSDVLAATSSEASDFTTTSCDRIINGVTDFSIWCYAENRGFKSPDGLGCVTWWLEQTDGKYVSNITNTTMYSYITIGFSQYSESSDKTYCVVDFWGY